MAALDGFRDDLKAGFGFVADILDRASARAEPPPVEPRTRPETEQATLASESPTTPPPPPPTAPPATTPPPPPPSAPPTTTPPPAPPPITGRTLLGPAANPQPFPVPGIAEREGEPLDFGEDKPKPPPSKPTVLDTEQPKRTTVLDLVPTPEPKRSTILDADLSPPATKPTKGRNARLDFTPEPPKRATILDVDLTPPKPTTPKRNREVLDLTPSPEPILPPGFEKDDQEPTRRKPPKPTRFFEDIPLADEVEQFVEEAKKPRSKTRVDGPDFLDEALGTRPQRPQGQREDADKEETLPELEKHTKLLESVLEWLKRTQPQLFPGGKAGPDALKSAKDELAVMMRDFPDLFRKSLADALPKPTQYDPGLPKLERIGDSTQADGVRLESWRADPNWSRPAQLPPSRQPERDAAWRAAQEHNNDPRGTLGRWFGMPKTSDDRNAPFFTRAASLSSGVGSFGDVARGIATTGGGLGISNEMGMLAKGAAATGDMLSKLGPVGMAAGAALKVVGGAAEAFGSVVGALNERMKKVGDYSGAIQAASARSEVREILRDLREAKQLGGKHAEFQGKQDDLKDTFAEAFLPVKEVLLDLVNGLLPIITGAVQVIAKILTDIYNSFIRFVNFFRDLVGNEPLDEIIADGIRLHEQGKPDDLKDDFLDGLKNQRGLLDADYTPPKSAPQAAVNLGGL